jgi:putative flippase GtrA
MPTDWTLLAKFCAVGASGYAVNLAVYVALVRGAGLHYLAAAVCSFLVAVTNNYTWNRLWTFRAQRGQVGRQGVRFLLVSTAALAANLLCLRALVELGSDVVSVQALAILLVTPISFLGNKLWSFRAPAERRLERGRRVGLSLALTVCLLGIIYLCFAFGRPQSVASSTALPSTGPRNDETPAPAGRVSLTPMTGTHHRTGLTATPPWLGTEVPAQRRACPANGSAWATSRGAESSARFFRWL